MKKNLLFLLAASALLFACQDKPDQKPEEVPASVDFTATTLVKGDVTTGEVNSFKVSAATDAATVDLTFYSTKTFLPEGTFSVGNGDGKYNGHYKDDLINADIAAGSVAVALDGKNYTISGELLLNNEKGTILNLNASGELDYPAPAEYYYTYTAGATANVYKVYDLEFHQVAEVSVVGAETGEFEINGSGENGTALLGTPNSGTWCWVEDFGTEIFVHGKVTVSDNSGRKKFAFEDIRSATFSNCELKNDITPVPLSNETKAPEAGKGIIRFFSSPSPLVEGMYELTVKHYYPDGREYSSCMTLCPTENPVIEKIGEGLPQYIVDYNTFKTFTAPSAMGERVTLSNTCYYILNGKKIEVGPSTDSGYFSMFLAVPGQAVLLFCTLEVVMPEDFGAACDNNWQSLLGVIAE